MFVLSELEHTLRLPPHLLNLPLNDAIKGVLDSLFLDKVIANLGLCVSIYDIRSIDGGFIFPGDGASTYTVKFRMVIFRPFVGEVITARLTESTINGLKLSLGFFDDIHVPAHLLFADNRHEPVPGHKDSVVWIWNFQGEDYPLDGVDEIKFKVHSVSYPPIPVDFGQDSEQKDVKRATMVVTGTLDMDGLGPVSWWAQSDSADDPEETTVEES